MAPFLRVAMASWLCGTALFTAVPLRAQQGADLSIRQQALNADDNSQQLEALMVPEKPRPWLIVSAASRTGFPKPDGRSVLASP